MSQQTRPFYLISHMNNTPAYVAESLGHGANGIECDVMCSAGEDGDMLSYRVYHGPVGPAYDEARVEASTPLREFCLAMRDLSQDYQHFALLIFDCKVDDVPANRLDECGRQLCADILDWLYSGDNPAEFTIVLSTASLENKGFFAHMPDAIEHRGAAERVALAIDETREVEAVESFLASLGARTWYAFGSSPYVDLALIEDFDLGWRDEATPALSRALKRRDQGDTIDKVYTWTVVREATMAMVLDMGVDGMQVDPAFHGLLDQGWLGKIIAFIRRLGAWIFRTRLPASPTNNILVLAKLLRQQRYRDRFHLATRDDSSLRGTH